MLRNTNKKAIPIKKARREWVFMNLRGMRKVVVKISSGAPGNLNFLGIHRLIRGALKKRLSPNNYIFIGKKLFR